MLVKDFIKKVKEEKHFLLTGSDFLYISSVPAADFIAVYGMRKFKYRSTDTFAFLPGENMNFCGFIFGDNLYFCNYDLAKFIDDYDDANSAAALTATISAAATAALADIVKNAAPLAAPAEMSIDVKNRIEYHTKYGAIETCERAFLTREPLKIYTGSISEKAITTGVILDYLRDAAGTVASLAQAEFTRDYNNIYVGYIYNTIDAELLATYNAGARPDLELRRAIAESVPADAATVNLEIFKNGDTMRIVYPADNVRRLKYCRDCSTYYMKPADREHFKKVHGNGADILPGDIVCMTYKKRELYHV